MAKGIQDLVTTPLLAFNEGVSLMPYRAIYFQTYLFHFGVKAIYNETKAHFQIDDRQIAR